MRHNKRWTESEDKFIRENYQSMAVPDIAKQLKRSPKATRSRIERLGFRLADLERNHQEWSQAELEIIKNNLEKAAREIQSELPDRSLNAIGNKRLFLGGRKYKGWHYDDYGRKQIRVKSRGYMAEYRYLMEQHLGRKLEKTEHVHHINGNKTDNRIENLYLYPNVSSHLVGHVSFQGIVPELMERNIIKFNPGTGKYELCENQ